MIIIQHLILHFESSDFKLVQCNTCIQAIFMECSGCACCILYKFACIAMNRSCRIFFDFLKNPAYFSINFPTVVHKVYLKECAYHGCYHLCLNWLENLGQYNGTLSNHWKVRPLNSNRRVETAAWCHQNRSTHAVRPCRFEPKTPKTCTNSDEIFHYNSWRILPNWQCLFVVRLLLFSVQVYFDILPPQPVNSGNL